MKVIEFQGNHKADSEPAPPMTLQPIPEPDLTPSPDVPLAILKRRMMASNDIREARKLLMDINTHLKVNKLAGLSTGSRTADSNPGFKPDGSPVQLLYVTLAAF